jgi:hypothetical protein
LLRRSRSKRTDCQRLHESTVGPWSRSRFCVDSLARPAPTRCVEAESWNKAGISAKLEQTKNREEGMSANSTRRKFFRSCLCCAPAGAPAMPARRNFLAGGVAALGLGAVPALGRIGPAAAQAPAANTRIDVHHHFIPQFHVDAMMAPGRRAGAPPPKWSPALSLEDMDKSG